MNDPDFIGYNAYHKMKPLYLSIFALLAVAIFLFTHAAAVQEPCGGADALRGAKLYEKAEGAYIGLLTNDTSYNCSKSGLPVLQKEHARTSYEIGRAYENAGQVEEARKAYVEALKFDPNITEAEEALFRVNGGIVKGIVTLPISRNTLISDLIIIIVLLVILEFSRWIIACFNKPQLDIKSFDKGANDPDIGKGMTLMVEESLKRFSTGRKHPKLKLVTEPIQELEIPANIAAYPQNLKYVFDLIKWISPPDVITLSGYLVKSKYEGAGVTLSLARNQTGKIIASRTIWQKEFGRIKSSSEIEPESYYILAETAAIWTLYELQKYRRKNEFHIFYVKDWLSYAYFRAGVRWETLGDRDLGRELYMKALGRDSNNLAAVLNLGHLDVHEEKYDRAIERLEYVKNNINPDDKEWGYIWFIAACHLAFSRKELGKKKITKEELEDILQKIDNIVNLKKKDWVSDVRMYLKKLGRKIDISNAKVLENPDESEESYVGMYLKKLKPEIEILFARVLADLGELEEAEKHIMNLNFLFSWSLTPKNQYNLACYYSIKGDNNKNENRVDAYQKALIHLKYALESNKNLVKDARNEKDFKGLSNGDLKIEFEKLLSKYAPEELLMSLSSISIIGKTNATNLTKLGCV